MAFLLCCVGILRSQDTIFLFRMDYMDSVYPIMKDSTSRFIIDIDGSGDDFFDSYFQRTVYGDRIIVPPRTIVWGLNVATFLGPRSIRDSVNIRGVVVQVVNGDYNNPICHYTNPLRAVSHRPYDLYWAFDHPTLCLTNEHDTNSYYVDTVLGVYSLYFDSPIQVADTIYVGMYVTGNRPAEVNPNYEGFRGIPTDVYHCDIIDCSCNDSCGFLGVEWVDEKNDMQLSLSLGPYNRGWVGCVFPIFTPPDTDSFGCPMVEGFAYAGVMADYPVFVWDTAGEHQLYEMAYGPYDAPLDSLHIVQTSNRYHELTGEQLSPEVYYQARLRAKCHHACPVHDTLMWTPWSDPIYFYIGDSMPDTAHHQPGETIADVSTVAAFTLTPNPAHGYVSLSVDSLVPVDGFLLTIHDVGGREMMRRTLHGSTTRLSLAGLSAGIYTISLSGPQGTAIRRLSVE